MLITLSLGFSCVNPGLSTPLLIGWREWSRQAKICALLALSGKRWFAGQPVLIGHMRVKAERVVRNRIRKLDRSLDKYRHTDEVTEFWIGTIGGRDLAATAAAHNSTSNSPPAECRASRAAYTRA